MTVQYQSPEFMPAEVAPVRQTAPLVLVVDDDQELCEFHRFPNPVRVFSPGSLEITCRQPLISEHKRTGQGALKSRSCRHLDVTRRTRQHRSDHTQYA